MTDYTPIQSSTTPAASSKTTSSSQDFPLEISAEQSHFDTPDQSPLLTREESQTAKEISDDYYDDFDAEHGVTGVPETASFFGCSVNLCNTILGTGMLAMSSAIASVGWLSGGILICFSGFASGLGLYLLSRCAARTEGRHSSFYAVSKLTFPRGAVFFDLAIALKCFGVSISYLIIIGDIMSHMFPHSLGYSLFNDRRFWIAIFMLIIAPLSFFKRLDSLRYTSFIALSAAAYLLFIVVYYFFVPTSGLHGEAEKNIQAVRISTNFFTNLPIFVFAFTCHQNCFSVYNELKDNSRSNMLRVIATAITSSTMMYLLIGLLGYFSFGNDVRPNIIMMYPTSLITKIGQICICVLVTLSYPLQAHPCRASLNQVLRFRSADSEQFKSANTPSSLKHSLITAGILLSSFSIAISVSKLDLVLSFVGSTGSTMISFILPGLFFWKLHENESHPSKSLSILLFIYGVLVMCLCLTFNILRVINEPL
ncbi:uncharacterized protein VTP21DRAFT_4624 [Calcarisporiella thermophila]|uniref:uncharacterized protein n=1 Tax=Calcarisporiella thermophila TaxID=911321 RepID=UPI003742AF18